MNFNRIESTVDVDTMKQSHATIIGGAYGLSHGLVRCGLGAITMDDFDKIDDTNPARQDFNSTDMGKFKVEANANILLKINPEVQVECYTYDYCALSQEEHDNLFGHTDLLIFAMDNFKGQARGNREAVRLGIPAIWIGLYLGGKAGEIIFYVPGKTYACYRCICESRYQAAQKGSIKVSSDGGTIFDLHLIDAIVGQIALGILTDGADNRFGRLIDQLGNRNLLQTKMDPNYRLGGKDIFGEYLGSHPANFSFTTIALPMQRERNCPDCGGQ